MYDENEWKNSLVMWILPDNLREAMPHFTQASRLIKNSFKLRLFRNGFLGRFDHLIIILLVSIIDCLLIYRAGSVAGSLLRASTLVSVRSGATTATFAMEQNSILLVKSLLLLRASNKCTSLSSQCLSTLRSLR